MIRASILVATYKRLALFKKCFESATKNPGIEDYEFFIWDNGSGDDMYEYLTSIRDPRVRVQLSDNVGSVAYRHMVEKTKGEHIVILDDDVIEFPDNWLKDMITALWDAPFPYRVWGMLTANVVQDEKTNGALWPDTLESFKKSGKHYEVVSQKGRKFYTGWTYGGWCAITHRDVYNMTLGFAKEAKSKKTEQKFPFFAIDGHYGQQVQALGLPTGIVQNIKVYHAAGPWWNKNYPELWKEKQQGETVQESARKYLERDPTLTAYTELL